MNDRTEGHGRKWQGISNPDISLWSGLNRIPNGKPIGRQNISFLSI